MARTDSVFESLDSETIIPNDPNGKDLWLAGSNKHLNFGGTDSGDSGYGIRDNAGAMEFKNSAGAWGGIGGGASTFVRSETIVIAAYNSLDTTDADHICTGTADEVVINNAINQIATTGGTLKLMEGNYTIDSSVVMASGVQLIGSGFGTILTGTVASMVIITAGATENWSVSSLKLRSLDGTHTASYGIRCTDTVSRIKITDCCFGEETDATSKITRAFGGYPNKSISYAKVTNNWNYHGYFLSNLSGFFQGLVTGNTHIGGLFFGAAGNINQCDISDNYIFVNPSVNDNAIVGASGLNSSVVSNNYIYGYGNTPAAGSALYFKGTDGSTITSNTLVLWDSDALVIEDYGANTIVTNNSFFRIDETTGNTYSCIVLGKDGGVTNCVVTGNIVYSPNAHKPKYGIIENHADSNYNLIANNSINGTGTADILTVGASTQVLNNLTISFDYPDRKVITKKNTSGGALAAGDVVILKAVATGDEVTTTTSGGDSKVLGMVVAAINDNAFGQIQTLGKTTALKVDGTADIAIGDFLSCFTTAKIAKKASAGETAFAIALEAYTTNDSAGIIDALLITPRTV